MALVRCCAIKSGTYLDKNGLDRESFGKAGLDKKGFVEKGSDDKCCDEG